MIVHKYTFGPFAENTYVLEDSESKNCIIIDPGMHGSEEKKEFLKSISDLGLNPKLLLNTHCHIDHVLSNKLIFDEFGLIPQAHEKASETLKMARTSAHVYGLDYEDSPEIEPSLHHEDIIDFGNHKLEVFFTPGHAQGHVVFYCQKDKYVINGDVLFRGSVGRVDLPGCNPADLVNSIQKVMYKLPNETVVYSGHGPETTIGEEKISNVFVRENESSL